MREGVTSILTNKTKDMTPFDMKRKPSKQYPFLMPLIWGASYLMTRPFHMKICKVHMENVKPPYLVLSTHQGFTDYYIGPLAMFPHRAVYVSDMEGFAAFGQWLYRGVGCIGKRRYVPDISVIVNMRYALSRGQSVVLYPESRHSNVGTTDYIPENMGRLAKMLGVPVVTISASGCYLANPFWQEEKTRKVPIKVKMECICNQETLKSTDAGILQKQIEQALTYDEYDYQHKAGFIITAKDRAEGLELVLYQCRSCAAAYHMHSGGIELWCDACGSKWELSEDGWLVPSMHKDDKTQNKARIHIPDWYEWQRKSVEMELSKTTAFEQRYEVRVEALPNEKGFVSLGEGELLLGQDAFKLTYTNLDGKRAQIVFPHYNRESVQTEYNYRKRGPCIVLSTQDCCYYLYSKQKDFNPTRLQFIGEQLFKQTRQ